MEIALAALADSANVSREGKLNLSGIYDTISAREFPATHPVLVLAFRLRLDPEDAKRTFPVTVQLIGGQEEKVIWEATTSVEYGGSAPGQFWHTNHIVELLGIQFAEPGQYFFDVRVEGDRRRLRVPFQVIKIQ